MFHWVKLRIKVKKEILSDNPKSELLCPLYFDFGHQPTNQGLTFMPFKHDSSQGKKLFLVLTKDLSLGCLLVGSLCLTHSILAAIINHIIFEKIKIVQIKKNCTASNGFLS